MTDAAERIGPGAFVAVVGASGVGKDSLIGYAAQRLDGLVEVPRRVVTRPAGPGEDHEPATEDDFAHRLAAGEYACHWRAHGLGYGIPAAVDRVVRDGRLVLANVSRAALSELEARYAVFRVVRVTASPGVRAERLARRGRESRAEIAHRLARVDPAPGHPAHLELANDGALADAGERLIAFLRGLAAD
jgi:ribose 1,5-bisphosphokinase